MKVRRASLADLDTLASLFDCYRQFYGQTSDLAGARRFLADRLTRDESAAFLAENDGEGTGFVQLFPSFTSAGLARIFILNDLFVSPAARRSGTARALLAAATGHAREAGAVALRLSTARDNVTAQALYEALGWQRDDIFLGYNLRLDPS